MYMIFYKNYPYSVLATMISAISSCVAFIFLILAFFCFGRLDNTVLRIVCGILCIVAAVFFFSYMSRVLPDKIAEKDFAKKIKTSARVAFLYCKDHPEHFEEVAANNPDFADKYRLNEDGKIVKNK